MHIRERQRTPLSQLREAHLQRSKGVQRAPKHSQGQRGVYDMYDTDDQPNGAYQVGLWSLFPRGVSKQLYKNRVPYMSS